MTDPAAQAPPLIFHLQAEVTLPTMADLRAELLAALEASDDVVVDATSVEEVDFAFFQTLCAAHREADARGKRLTLTPRTPRITDLMRRAGFARRQGNCPGCLWAETDHE